MFRFLSSFLSSFLNLLKSKCGFGFGSILLLLFSSTFIALALALALALAIGCFGCFGSFILCLYISGFEGSNGGKVIALALYPSNNVCLGAGIVSSNNDNTSCDGSCLNASRLVVLNAPFSINHNNCALDSASDASSNSKSPILVL